MTVIRVASFWAPAASFQALSFCMAANDASKLQPIVQPASQKLGILEEDDEFEEFPVEDWADAETANKLELAEAWTNDWDDETVEDDFAHQLRAEIQKLNNAATSN